MQGAGQDEVAGAQRHAELAQLVGEPGDAAIGCRATAAPAPSRDRPSTVSTMPIVRRSRSAIGTSRPPQTTRAEEALSAIVSGSLIFQSATRLSMISSAGSARRPPAARRRS